MRKKTAEKRKPHIKYYKAPPKSRASVFFTSFFLSLAVCFFASAFLLADRNSQRLGFGRNVEVFDVINNQKSIGITFMGTDFTLDSSCKKGAADVLKKIGTARLLFEPEPVLLAEMLGDRLSCFENDILSKCDFIPQQLR